MNFKSLFITLILLVSLAVHTAAQKNLTGRWEGVLKGELIQLNIEHQKNQFCVYSYDYELGQKDSSYCRASYQTYFLDEEGTWFIRGNKMLENSGTHVFMQMKLWRAPGDARNKLRATVSTRGVSLLLHDAMSDMLILSKVNNKPLPLPGHTGVCPDSPPEKKEVPKAKPVPKSTPKPSPKPKQKPTPAPVPTVPKQEVPAVQRPVTPKKNDSTEIKLKQMNARKQSEQSRLTVNVKEISLKLYDNGVVDNDIISVFYNGRLLVSNQKLSEQAIELKIKLDENIPLHEITLYAENLGEIPPNTALIIVTAGKKRYELRSKADLQENAVLVFEYKPE